MAAAARAPGCRSLGGDTKVVEHGKADRMYITTTGIGEPLPGVSLGAATGPARGPRAAVGPDRRSRHHDPARARRARPRGRPPLRHAVGAAAGRGARRRGRRPASAGCATRPAAASPRRSTSWRATAVWRSHLAEERVPVRDGVRGACELLGLDPLHIANEGQFLAVVAPDLADRALAALRAAPGGAVRRRHRRDPRVSRAARCSSRPTTAAAASSTCWSATPCRGSADRRATVMHRRRARSPTPSRQRLRRRNDAVARVLRPRGAAAGRRLPARWPSGSSAAAACWRSARARCATDAQHVSVEFVHP